MKIIGKKTLWPALCLCLLLTACGGGEGRATAATQGPDVDPEELARAAVESQADGAELTALTGQDLTDHLSALCGLTDWEAGAVYAAGGMDAREITVVLLADETAAETAADTLENYRLERQGDFFGYAPEEAALLGEAVVLHRGSYAALLACGDPEAAQVALDACLAGEPLPPTESETDAPTPTPELAATQAMAPVTPSPMPKPSATPTPTPAPVSTPTPVPSETPVESERSIVNPDLDIRTFVPFDPPNDTDMEVYDTSAIQAAWITGEEGGLSEKDAAILARCREVLGSRGKSDLQWRRVQRQSA